MAEHSSTKVLIVGHPSNVYPTAVQHVKQLASRGLEVVVHGSRPLFQLLKTANDVNCTFVDGSSSAPVNSELRAVLAFLPFELKPKTFPVGLAEDIRCVSLLRSLALDVPIITEETDLLAFAEFAEIPPRKWRSEMQFKFFSKVTTFDAGVARTLPALYDEKVLLIGNGGREHAIAWKLAQSEFVSEIFVAPGNGGTDSTPGSKISNVQLDTSNKEEVVAFAVQNNIGLCVVGPEAPLVDGLADAVNGAGIATFGPSAAAAQLEASKAFSKDFMTRHGIPTAEYRNFRDYDAARAYVESVRHSVVVKASGIAAGKGVLIPRSKQEALEAVKEVMVDRAYGSAGEEVVIEQLLEGEEVSVLAFCDGVDVVVMPAAQDHKRALDDDEGLNTGGMGAYAPATVLSPALQKETEAMLLRVVRAMAAEGTPYVGVLYAGLILTKEHGAMVLEFNCRFGDPETQVLLPLLQSDLFEVLMACTQRALANVRVKWSDGACAAVVMASGGYPEAYANGKLVTGISDAIQTTKGGSTQVCVFQAGTKRTDDGSSVATSGGRVLAVSAVAGSLREAIQTCYGAVRCINFDGAHFRSDIALKGLLHGRAPIRLAVLGSTRGSSMEPIIEAIKTRALNASIEVVISNKASAGILDRAAGHGIPTEWFSAKGLTREQFDAEVSRTLREKYNVDLVLLIGYMRILSPQFCKEWQHKVLNVHPSLLPDFAGGMDLAVHQAVLDAKRSKSGCTVHYVTEQVDQGPIAVQLETEIAEGETAESLKAKVQPLEGKAFLRAIKFHHAGISTTSNAQNKVIDYADAGVSIDAGNELVERIKPFCKATRRTGCDSDLGGFGGLFDLSKAGFGEDTVLVACTDGVGTKLKIAQYMRNHRTIGIDLVAMCVNDLLVQGAEPLFFLDYYACGKLQVEEAANVVEGIAAGCVESVCGLIGGETAEMPSMYSSGDYDLAGFCIGAVHREKLLPKPILPSEEYTVLGMASSGIHSNGYSLVRKLVEEHGFGYNDPCPFDSSQSIGERLLVPTRIYVKQLMPLIREELLVALAHITGGGLIENIPRVLPKDTKVTVNCGSWTLPAVFKWLQKLSNLPDEEFARTFNCGVGMVLIVRTENVSRVQTVLNSLNEQVFVMGKLESRSDSEEQVILKGAL